MASLADQVNVKLQLSSSTRVVPNFPMSGKQLCEHEQEISTGFIITFSTQQYPTEFKWFYYIRIHVQSRKIRKYT